MNEKRITIQPDYWYVILCNEDGSMKAGDDEDIVLEFETHEDARLRMAEEEEQGEVCTILPGWMWQDSQSVIEELQSITQEWRGAINHFRTEGKRASEGSVVNIRAFAIAGSYTTAIDDIELLIKKRKLHGGAS